MDFQFDQVSIFYLLQFLLQLAYMTVWLSESPTNKKTHEWVEVDIPIQISPIKEAASGGHVREMTI